MITNRREPAGLNYSYRLCLTRLNDWIPFSVFLSAGFTLASLYHALLIIHHLFTYALIRVTRSWLKSPCIQNVLGFEHQGIKT